MDIVIFKELTTNDYINQLEEESKKYTGLYVDMNNAPERKYVKDKAYDIQQLLKTIDTERIKETKRYKSVVENEANEIKERLINANMPFTLLIEEHKAERAKILADEKRVIAWREAAEQKENDHEMALLINKTFEFDKAELIRIKHESDEQFRIDAELKAAANQILINEAIERDKIYAENARLASVEHVRSVNIAILDCMIAHGLPCEESKSFIKTLAKKELSQLTINY